MADGSRTFPPACNAMAPAGSVLARIFPIAGQPAGYLRNQLKAWRSGDRPAGPQGLMGHIAEQLDADDLKAVAEYFASCRRPRRRTMSRSLAIVIAGSVLVAGWPGHWPRY